MRHETEHARLRRQWRECADQYFRAITGKGYSPEHRDNAAYELARVALRLHIFEQGRRSK